MSAANDYAAYLHTARVYLREARSRARNPVMRSFCFRLIESAGNMRRKAMASRQPVQASLF